MRLGLCTAVAVLALSFVAPAAVGETAEETHARFQLFANCEPIDLDVMYSDGSFRRGSPTEDAIQAAAESRLRSARLFSLRGETRLKIEVRTWKNDGTIDWSTLETEDKGNGFRISIAYYKRLSDVLSDTSKYMATWEREKVGKDYKNMDYILYGVSALLDEFLLAFLRVNEQACAKR